MRIWVYKDTESLAMQHKKNSHLNFTTVQESKYMVSKYFMMHFRQAIIPLLALAANTVSASYSWGLWMNWDANCGGHSWEAQGTGNQGCTAAANPNGNWETCQSFDFYTQISTEEGYCKLFIYSDPDCKSPMGKLCSGKTF